MEEKSKKKKKKRKKSLKKKIDDFGTRKEQDDSHMGKIKFKKPPININMTGFDLMEKDLEVFKWIQRYIVSMGYPPSVQDISQHFVLGSKRMAFIILGRLQAYGFLDIDKGVTRGIRIHNFPDPDELGVAKLKQWLSEATEFLRKYEGSDPNVSKFLHKISVIVF